MADGPLRIGLEAIESSSLAALGYDEQRQIVAVKFKSGAIFNYGSFPPDQMLAFYAAPSRGKWFAEHIKGKYPGLKMTGDCPACGAKNGWIGDRCEDCGCADYEATRTGSGNGRAGGEQPSSGIDE
jgi:KTSC domain